MTLPKAVVFDMDGVLVNSETVWRKYETDYYHQLIPGIRQDFFERIIGTSVELIHQLLVEEYDFQLSFEEFMISNRSIAEKVYREVRLMEGILDLLQELTDHNIPLALASSSSVYCIDMVLDRFQLRNRFRSILSADHVKGEGKPKPDIYLECCARLGHPPESCVAIEDSTNGIISARTAGMKVIAYHNVENPVQDHSSADVIVPSHHQINPSFLQRLMQDK